LSDERAMVDRLRPLRINAVELLRQPGAVRDIDVTIDAEPLDARHERLDGDIHVELVLEALNDGIEVTGTVSARWATVCRRCLADVAGVAVGDVDELYQIQPLDPDAYLIEDGQLDLAPLVRETVLIELDLERQCRAACAGLCPVCGADRNTTDCDCDPTIRDDRWAALEGFVPDDES
jgi:uncharacterized protein